MKPLLNEYGSKDRDLFQLVISEETHNNSLNIVGNQIFGASDSDYANKLEESRKSTSGYVFFFRHNLVCWKSKLQPILATSTHEAELIAMNLAAQEAIWLRNFLVEVQAALTGRSYEELYDDPEKLQDRNHSQLSPTFVLCDNLGAVHTSANPVSSKRSKHVDIRYLKIREYQEQQRLITKHIDGDKNVADMFTKPLTSPTFKKYLEFISLTGPRTRQPSKKQVTARAFTLWTLHNRQPESTSSCSPR